MEARLLRRPAELGVELEKALDKVDERHAVFSLCIVRSPTGKSVSYKSRPSPAKKERERNANGPLSISASLYPFLPIGY